MISVTRNEIEFPVLTATQPIGTFYVGVVSASDLYQIAKADVRQLADAAVGRAASGDVFAEYMGIQRPLDPKRVIEIRDYVRTVDASFPNAIIVAVDSQNVEVSDGRMRIRREPNVARIIDGQHRLAGIGNGTALDFDLIVTVFLDMEVEEQAYLFATINTKHVKINPSLAADLLEFSSVETPEKVAHNIAKLFNSESKSPWFRQIKMLGRKDELSAGIITQSTFTREIIDLMYDSTQHHVVRDILKRANGDRRNLSRDVHIDTESYPFWEFYVLARDDAIFRILSNYFRAFADVFVKEWGNPEYILSKTIGYGAMMLGLKSLIKEGLGARSLSYEFFRDVANRGRNRLATRKLSLTSVHFPPGTTGTRSLWRILYQDTS